MNITRWVLIGLTFTIAAVLIFNIQIWAEEFKKTFMYNNDFLSYVMVFVFVISLTGIFRWLLKKEISLTDPKRKRRLKK